MPDDIKSFQSYTVIPQRLRQIRETLCPNTEFDKLPADAEKCSDCKKMICYQHIPALLNKNSTVNLKLTVHKSYPNNSWINPSFSTSYLVDDLPKTLLSHTILIQGKISYMISEYKGKKSENVVFEIEKSNHLLYLFFHTLYTADRIKSLLYDIEKPVFEKSFSDGFKFFSKYIDNAKVTFNQNGEKRMLPIKSYFDKFGQFKGETCSALVKPSIISKHDVTATVDSEPRSYKSLKVGFAFETIIIENSEEEQILDTDGKIITLKKVKEDQGGSSSSKKSKKTMNKLLKEDSDSDDTESEEEAPPPKKKGKKPTKKVSKPDTDESDVDIDADISFKPKKGSKKPVVKSDSEESEDEVPPPKKSSKKPVIEESEDEESEEEVKPKKKSKKDSSLELKKSKKEPKKAVIEDSDEEDDDDIFNSSPKKAPKKKNRH
ncbi:hypothetical protein [Carp edema virus]|nr:hypothetical protein [Carp edema virus]